MKSRFFFPAVIFTSVVLFICCNKDNTEKHSTEQLKQELTILNGSISESIGITFDNTKGFWSAVGKVCAVAGADMTGAYAGAQVGGEIGAYVGAVAGNPPAGAAIGATAGAVICGVGASYSAGQALKNSKNLDNPYPNGYNSSLSSPYANNNNIGFLHNKYLDLIFTMNNEVTPTDVYQHLFENLCEYSLFDGLFQKIGPETQIHQDVSKISTTYISLDYNIDYLISEYGKILDFPESITNIWLYFFNAFSSVETIEDAYMVVDTYIEWLDNNGKEYVSPEEYIAFQYAFNTALHSINYWSFLN